MTDNTPTMYGVSDARIAEVREAYANLTFSDLSDTEGIAAVTHARKHVKKLRVQIEHKRKELNADAQAHIKAVNAEAKRLKEPLLEIENGLIAEEERAKRLKKEKEEAEAAALDALVDQRAELMADVGARIPPSLLRKMTEAEFDEALEDAKKTFAAKARARAAREKRNPVKDKPKESVEKHVRAAAETLTPEQLEAVTEVAWKLAAFGEIFSKHGLTKAARIVRNAERQLSNLCK